MLLECIVKHSWNLFYSYQASFTICQSYPGPGFFGCIAAQLHAVFSSFISLPLKPHHAISFVEFFFANGLRSRRGPWFSLCFAVYVLLLSVFFPTIPLSMSFHLGSCAFQTRPLRDSLWYFCIEGSSYGTFASIEITKPGTLEHPWILPSHYAQHMLDYSISAGKMDRVP